MYLHAMMITGMYMCEICVRMNDTDLCLPEDRVSKLRFLAPQCHLLPARVQTEISIGMTWLGKLSQVAKLQFMVDPENLEQKWAFVKEWQPDSKFMALQCMLTKSKKQEGIEDFMKAIDIFAANPEFAQPF
jgi:hypothetical protein